MAKLMWALCLVAAWAVWVSSAASPCDSVVMDMTDCLSYVTSGSNETAPEKACCISVAEVVKVSPVCLCTALQMGSSMGFDVNMTRALDLPKDCSVSVPDLHHSSGNEGRNEIDTLALRSSVLNDRTQSSQIESHLSEPLSNRMLTNWELGTTFGCHKQ